MTVAEMYAKVKAIYEATESQYSYIGLRFEDKSREIGEECEWSRHNADREDEREFPAYGTEEYQEMELLQGTSVWDLSAQTDKHLPGYGRSINLDRDAEKSFNTYHCYVVAGNKAGRHNESDDGEILIQDATVIARIF